MGESFRATCKTCGTEFEADRGGGFFFHLFRCDQCGATRAISFQELGELHQQYLKGLPRPYCIASSESDAKVKETYPGEPISEQQYEEAIEKRAGRCQCQGRFRFEAPLRCPRCRSTDIEEGATLVMYD